MKGERVEPTEFLSAVERRWKRDDASTAGDLGTIALYTLVKSYTDVRRAIHNWLDDVEMAFLQTDQGAGDVDQRDVVALRLVVGQLMRRVRALKTPSERESDSWFFKRQHPTRAKETDEKLDRALNDFDRMAERIHTILDLMQLTVAKRQQAIATEQEAIAAKQQQTSEALQRRFELVTSVLLVPTLIAGLFGANTALPGGNSWSGFGLMVVLMVLGGLASYVFLKRTHGSAGGSVESD